jgi:hypothetical protein
LSAQVERRYGPQLAARKAEDVQDEAARVAMRAPVMILRDTFLVPEQRLRLMLYEPRYLRMAEIALDGNRRFALQESVADTDGVIIEVEQAARLDAQRLIVSCVCKGCGRRGARWPLVAVSVRLSLWLKQRPAAVVARARRRYTVVSAPATNPGETDGLHFVSGELLEDDFVPSPMVARMQQLRRSLSATRALGGAACARRTHPSQPTRARRRRCGCACSRPHARRTLAHRGARAHCTVRSSAPARRACVCVCVCVCPA